MELKQTLGERCRTLRLQRRFSQVDIIRNFDFSLSHYQKIERGKLDPRLTTLKKLAEIYQVTLAQLVEGL